MIKSELMPFKKFVQSKNILYEEETIKINGTFKERSSGRIIKNDIFEAHKLGKLSLREIYKIYLKWFNHTRTEYEDERIFVSVEKKDVKNEK